MDEKALKIASRVINDTWASIYRRCHSLGEPTDTINQPLVQSMEEAIIKVVQAHILTLEQTK